MCPDAYNVSSRAAALPLLGQAFIDLTCLTLNVPERYFGLGCALPGCFWGSVEKVVKIVVDGGDAGEEAVFLVAEAGLKTI